MPGIVGIITKRPRKCAEAELLRMLSVLRHEPFYRSGTWADESLGVYVGWTVIENSFADGMPLSDLESNATLIFSGEEYSGSEADAHRNGSAVSAKKTQASYLSKLARDPEFPANLNGLFHGVLARAKEGTVQIFNDRYGMHRLYYHDSGDSLYFAAEAKAILEVLPQLRTPSQRGLGEFLTCSCVLEDRTIFKDIFVLPAASSWIFQNGRPLRKSTYFYPRQWEEQDPLDAELFYQQMQSTLSERLPNYFGGPERVGIALTGGMDTRVLIAQHPPLAGEVPCYTFGGMYRDCEDVRLARKVATLSRQKHDLIQVGDEFLRRFPEYAERSVYLTEGTVDVYRSSDLYVSERARAIAPVKVVGTYGSEIIRHAVMFKPMAPAQDLLCADFAPHIHDARETYAAIRRVHPVTFAAFRQSPWYHHGILSLEQTQLTVRSPYLDNHFVKTVYRAPRTVAPQDDIRLRLIHDGSTELSRIPSDRGAGGSSGRIGSAIIRAYREFTFKAEYAYDYGMPQWVSRIDHLLAPLRLERLFLGRHKFLHYRVWYRDALADYVKQILLDERTLSRPYVNRKSLTAAVNGHLKEGRNYTTAIHKMLTLELLQRRFFDAR